LGESRHDAGFTRCARLRGPCAECGIRGRRPCGDGVAEGGAAVEVRLPEALEDVEIVFPAAFVEAFAEGVGSVAGEGCAARVFAGTVGRASGGTGAGAKVQFAGVASE